jgi:hypothetical protein
MLGKSAFAVAHRSLTRHDFENAEALINVTQHVQDEGNAG